MTKNKQARDAENPQWRKEIGVRIGKVREERGMSQGELADRLGVNRVTMTYWENGTRDIKTTDIVRLADALGVSCDYLLRGITQKDDTGTIKSMIERIADEKIKVAETAIAELKQAILSI